MTTNRNKIRMKLWQIFPFAFFPHFLVLIFAIKLSLSFFFLIWYKALRTIDYHTACDNFYYNLIRYYLKYFWWGIFMLDNKCPTTDRKPVLMFFQLNFLLELAIFYNVRKWEKKNTILVWNNFKLVFFWQKNSKKF